MSLNYELSKIKDWSELCFITATEDMPMHGLRKGEKYINPKTQNIIFSTIAVGMGTITEENYIEFYIRNKIWDLTHHMTDGISLEDIKKHIGLRTNVFPKESNSAFYDKIYKAMEYETILMEKSHGH
jgi:hypothetical protein